MIGWYRFCLASLVVISHLGGRDLDLANGLYAVQGFFVISGYLMTAILNGVYAGRPLAFWTNRLLKLFPVYYIVCLAVLALIIALPDETANWHPSWRSVDASPFAIVANVSMVIFAFREPHWMLIPPTWSVAVEIVNYAIVFFLTSRSKRMAIAMFVLGIAIHTYAIVTGDLQMDVRYTSRIGGIFPFSVGALGYFLTAANRSVSIGMGVVAAILWIGNLALGDSLGFGYLRNEVLWYSNIALAAVVVCAFAPLRRKGALARIDNFVGELAYPIFLVHLAVGCVLYHWLPDLAGPAFWFSLGLSTLIVSWLIARGADFAVEPLRTQIRATHNVTAQSSVVA